ncbi:hypothetical protein LSUB1_G004672 [Lachnellula subtilissima]|uniref:Uncharacterized protein n=1 Tax=Lachnellula subtilissima TaxID=602034 RepID=A0A8H8RGY6_9HELO|nr:hypothetical protein LSUB1_G004672 [Lachnellula subtilissima]
MAWFAIVIRIFSYILLPIKLLFHALFILLAPVLHLGSYVITGFMLPFRLLAKFETLYIYLGVAAVIGVITGSLLHIFSTVLISTFDLAAVPEDTGRTAASIRAAREQKKLEGAWESSISKSESARLKNYPLTRKQQTEWLESELSKRRENQLLLGQTIIEEDDDSEDRF